MSSDDGYAITVSVATVHGRRTVHNFAFDAPNGNWWAWNPPSPEQIAEHLRGLKDSGYTREFDGHLVIYGRPDQHPQPRRPEGLGRTRPLNDDYGSAVHLSDGVDLDAADLAVILDALRSDERHQVDIADMKRVVSQLGSRIARLGALDETLRGHAVNALYVEILRRCTSL